MTQKFKNIISVLMVLILFLPSIVKLEHHHEHFFCRATTEKHLHTFHNQCPICSFEFSVFTSYNNSIVIPKEKHEDCFSNNYQSKTYSNLSKFSFSLRAPPCKQI